MYAAAHPHQEVCGFVISGWQFIPVENVAKNKSREFAFNSYGQRKAILHAIGFGREILGVFHSHPGGTESPSETDIAGWPFVDSANDYCRYWIISGGEVNEWTLVDGKPERI